MQGFFGGSRVFHLLTVALVLVTNDLFSKTFTLEDKKKNNVSIK